jgi:exodeoxyribonuclease VII large subunit
MPKIAKSQWEFGELFQPEQTRRVFTVSELTGQIRRVLEKQIGQIWISGEITNLRAQSSGHIYFTLKDSTAQLSCVLFRGEQVANRDHLEDGRMVLLQGELTVYEPRGQYQLRVQAIELQGTGALQVAFEKLKQKLLTEGLFAAERKRPLPRFPERIGLVTSPTGAAIRDVLHVIERRHPGLELILAPCRVQGQGAAEEIAAAMALLNGWSATLEGRGERGLDLILLTRGGGSLEDLWAFNEEVLARAIFESRLPVVSAVGHEIDSTISDFVADVRAATPSAAAEIITEGVFASCRFISEATDWMRQRVRQELERRAKAAQQLIQRLARAHPRRRLNERLQRLDDLQSSLARCVKQGWREGTRAWQNLHERLRRLRPRQVLAQRRELLHQEHCRLIEMARHRFSTLQNRLEHLESRLRLLSPEHVLARGYSITMDAETGKILRNASEIQPGKRLRTKLQSGEVRSIAERNSEGS